VRRTGSTSVFFDKNGLASFSVLGGVTDAGGGSDGSGGSDGGGESPNCTVLTSPQGVPIVDAAGNKWTLVSTTANGLEIYENGQYSSPTALVTELIYINHVVWQENSAGGWWSWTNGAWQSGSNPTAACPVESANCTALTSPQGAPIVDAAGNKWTLVSTTANGLEIYENGQYSSPTALVTELIYVNHVVWQENSYGGWWSWVNGAWQSGSNPTGACGVADASASAGPCGNRAPGGFCDDFTGAAGTKPNPADWSLLSAANCNGAIGTCTPNNVYLDGQGHVVLEVTQSGNTTYAAWMDSFGVSNPPPLSFGYGRLEASIKFPPISTGFWPAFFIVGSSIDSVGWPTCGEIDIYEYGWPGDPYTTGYNASLHGNNGSGGATTFTTHVEASSIGASDFTDAYHTYWMVHEANSITVGVDSFSIGTWTPTNTSPYTWPLNQNITPLLVFTVNQTAPSAASLPAQMLVDWIRFTPG
jgi:hypothetical protein